MGVLISDDLLCACGELAVTERDDGTPLCEDCRPSPVKCSYPNCERMTMRDPVYDDLCYEHVRCEND